MSKLKAPWPAFGAKSKVAAMAWERLGNPCNYVEPFAHSAAMLLGRPHLGRIETINDSDHFVSNFWRAVKADPDGVAHHANSPVSEVDLHARHRYLVGFEVPDPIIPAEYDDAKSRDAYLAGFKAAGAGSGAAGFRARMLADPDYYDVRRAGWWVWGACCWIGGGWCAYSDGPGRRPALSNEGHGVNVPTAKLPRLAGGRRGDLYYGGIGVTKELPALHDKRPGAHGRGVNAADPGTTNRLNLADAYSRGRGVHANDAASRDDDREEWLRGWMRDLCNRFRPVRVCCGDWSRVCGSMSTTTRLGATAIFLDPPYAKSKSRLLDWIRHLDGNGAEPGPLRGSKDKNRAGNLYSNDGQDVDRLVADVHRYCREWGAKKGIRIAVCGLEGEHDQLLSHGWEAVAWKSSGYGNRSAGGRANAMRERVWFSPECLPRLEYPLFEHYGLES